MNQPQAIDGTNVCSATGPQAVEWQKIILDSADLTVISTDTTGLIQTINEGALQKLGYAPDEIIGKITPVSLHDSEEMAQRAEALADELGHPLEADFDVFVAKARQGQTDENEWTYIRKDGTRFPVRLAVTALRDDSGAIIGFVGIGKDISEQRRAESILRESEDRFRQLAEAAFEGIILSRQGVLVDANSQFGRLFGYSSQELVGMRIPEFVIPKDRAEVEQKIQTSNETIYECMGLRKDGSTFPIEVRGKSLQLPQGPGRIAAIRDITESKRFEQQLLEQQQQLAAANAQLAAANAQLEATNGKLAAANTQLEAANARLEALSRTDALTELCNRRAFEEGFKNEFDRACRQKTALSLILMDLDAFKSYNDNFGHPAGDRVLQEVARVLLALARTTDIVARVGGEEFAIILPATDAEGAHISAERFRVGLENTAWPNRQVSASFGVATVHPLFTQRDYSSVIEAADRALYHSKQNGRNRVT